MSSTTTVLNNTSSKIHPQKFLLWCGLVSIVMMFAGFTSAFIVRQAQGNWYEYVIPNIFWTSTILIILSSICMIIATSAWRKDKRGLYQAMLGASLILGCVFVYCQYEGFLQLKENGVYLEGNPSGSFFYIIAGLHALHVLGGILFLLIFFLKALRKLGPVKKLLLDINPNKNLGIELLATYWHFIGILWIYLFIFLKYYE